MTHRELGFFVLGVAAGLSIQADVTITQMPRRNAGTVHR